MASSSNSSIEKSFKYDVFLSFRGKDTRKNFVGHLYEALQAKCIETYKDDETVEQGERINNQLLKSIEDSKFYIIVFSKNYASSSWCLDELLKIMECQKMTEHTAFPVFYDVEPTEVRKQSGAVKEAFAKHEKEEAAEKWRDAMKELAVLAGWELKATANGDESKLMHIIVDTIFKKLHSINSIADEKLVGIETRISGVLSSLEISAEDVRMIGIKGMGGGGKTTLARAIYDRMSTMFKVKSFVENVREVSKPSLCGLRKLQKRILKDVLNKKDINLSSVHDGRNMLKATMRRRKILVVLDDVDCIEQLEALAGDSNWFKSGSRIIITTRDEQVLRAHGVNFVHDVNLLSSTEAICLFSMYAFKKEIPIRGYEKLSRQVVRYADGLPLTLKVLGSFLCCKDKLEWVDAIKRLTKIPLKDTLEKLELSYISLEDEYKEIFLDIACILKGKSKDDIIRIFESCGFYARNGLKVLEQRSLITISSRYGKLVLGMHDHIEEMGKNIVRRSHPKEPNKHSHLWINKEIEDILANDMGTEETRCIKLNNSRVHTEIVMKGLGKMKKLRCLYINHSKLRTFDLMLTPNLEVLSLEYCADFVKLHVSAACQNLKILNICNSSLRSLDLELIPNLESLNLENSNELVEINAPVGCLKKVGYLNLSGCLRFTHFVSKASRSSATLDLTGKFQDLSEPKVSHSSATLDLTFQDLCPLPPNCNLSKLRFHCSYIEYLPSSVGNIEKLISFGLCACTDLEKFWNIIYSLQGLTSLALKCNFPELPKDLSQLKCLEELRLYSTKITHLPDSICMLKHLKYLNLHLCALLEKLPEDIGRLKCLEHLDITNTCISYLPQSIFRLKGLLIAASSEVLQLYDFPSKKIKTTTTHIRYSYQQMQQMQQIRPIEEMQQLQQMPRQLEKLSSSLMDILHPAQTID